MGKLLDDVIAELSYDYDDEEERAQAIITLLRESLAQEIRESIPESEEGSNLVTDLGYPTLEVACELLVGAIEPKDVEKRVKGIFSKTAIQQEINFQEYGAATITHNQGARYIQVNTDWAVIIENTANGNENSIQLFCTPCGKVIQSGLVEATATDEELLLVSANIYSKHGCPFGGVII